MKKKVLFAMMMSGALLFGMSSMTAMNVHAAEELIEEPEDGELEEIIVVDIGDGPADQTDDDVTEITDGSEVVDIEYVDVPDDQIVLEPEDPDEGITDLFSASAFGLNPSYTGLARVPDDPKYDLWAGTYVYLQNGKWAVSTMFAPYNGERVFIVNGCWAMNASGLVNDPNNTADWYYLAVGRVVKEYTGLVQYDGAWFYVDCGKLDTKLAGFVEYDGAHFLVGAGRVQYEVSGLVEDPARPGRWCYFALGMAQEQYTGLVEYDNHLFYVKNGYLDVSFSGTVTYLHKQYRVVNGMV